MKLRTGCTFWHAQSIPPVYPSEEVYTVKKLLHLLMILAGNLLLAFCVSHFVVPAGLISGGATGLSLAAHHLLPGVPLEVWIWGLTIFFFALGAILLGREFALSTLVSTVAYPLFFSLFRS